MYTVYKRAITDWNLTTAVWIIVDKVLAKAGEKNTFFAQLAAWRTEPWITGMFCKQASIKLPTANPQDLGIQALLDFCDRGTDVRIKTHLFLNLLNRMDGGGMIFAPKLTGNLREA